MTFSEALELLKVGREVRRKGWNGKGQSVLLIGGEEFGSFAIDPCLAIRTVNGSLQPGWLASQADLLADDWEVIEE